MTRHPIPNAHPVKTYQQVMPPSILKAWNAQQEAQQERRQVEERRRELLLRMKQSVVVEIWFKVSDVLTIRNEYANRGVGWGSATVTHATGHQAMADHQSVVTLRHHVRVQA